MKVAIIGGQASTTLIEALIKAVEEKTGEKIEFVDMHSKDIEEFTQILPTDTKKYTLELASIVEPFDPEGKYFRKGHKKPYKFHR